MAIQKRFDMPHLHAYGTPERKFRATVADCHVDPRYLRAVVPKWNLAFACEVRGPKYTGDTGFYKPKGWAITDTKPTGYAPLLTPAEAESERRKIEHAASEEIGSKRMVLAIEASDMVQSLEEIAWLVPLKEKYRAVSVQLTYNHQNHIATGCCVKVEDGMGWHYDNTSGLNPNNGFGDEFVKKLLEAGITVDVSHLNKASTLKVCEIAQGLGKPVIASHSNALAVFNKKNLHSETESRSEGAQRCLDDGEIKALLKTGGFVGLMPAPWFLTEDIRKAHPPAIAENMKRELGRPLTHAELKEIADGANSADMAALRKGSIDVLVRHIKHVMRLAGKNASSAVALASDADPTCITHGYGIWRVKWDTNRNRGELIADPLPEYSEIFDDVASRLKGNWPAEDIAALLHGNAERIFEAEKK
jgi:microsomal dipeptidase-like Zn-dependent dipeptidase